MKRIFTLLMLALMLNAQAQLTDEVARLDSIYGLAGQISNDPTTGFERIAAHKSLEWDSQRMTISDSWMIFSYKNDSLVYAQGVKNPYERSLNINRYSYIDSLGVQVADTVPGAFLQYQYFYNLIGSGEPLFDVIRDNLYLADSLGKFD